MNEIWIIDQLVQQGVKHFCVAPGSRSTPLVSAAAEHPRAQLHVHYDERGLGFFALGIGKATHTPAAIIATSGTAVGNLLPCVMEAHHSCTPLILLTADRPDELRDCSANQTTDQVNIFQSFVRWHTDLAIDLNEKTFRSMMAQGFFYALQNPPGPVHINCPFRDPLYCPDHKIVQGKPMQLQFPRHRVDPYKTEKTKGLILIGRLPNPNDVLAVLEMAERLRWPVCADILSHCRADQILRLDRQTDPRIGPPFWGEDDLEEDPRVAQTDPTRIHPHQSMALFARPRENPYRKSASRHPRILPVL